MRTGCGEIVATDNFLKSVMAEWLGRWHLSDMKCTVMVWRSWDRTPVMLKLGCIVL